MAKIAFDALNIYVTSKIPTLMYLKVIITIFNIICIIGLFVFAIALQEDQPNPFPFLIPVAYSLTAGKYFLWNTFGEELYIISTTHISYQHSYGLWKTKFVTSKYDSIAIENIETSNKEIKLIFIGITAEKLQEEIFTTTLSLKQIDSNEIFNRLKEMKINEFNEEIAFPKIFSN